MKCSNCEKIMTETTENYHYLESGLSNITLMGIVVRKCNSCGNIMPMIPNIEGLHNSIAQSLIKQEEKLTPEQIVFLRKYLGWSCKDFAQNMQCDKTQISKWENGKIPMSKPYELLFREIVASGRKIQDYNRHDAAKKKVFKPRPVMLKLEEKSWRDAA